jgi:hypothetical protein
VGPLPFPAAPTSPPSFHRIHFVRLFVEAHPEAQHDDGCSWWPLHADASCIRGAFAQKATMPSPPAAPRNKHRSDSRQRAPRADLELIYGPGAAGLNVEELPPSRWCSIDRSGIRRRRAEKGQLAPRPAQRRC